MKKFLPYILIIIILSILLIPSIEIRAFVDPTSGQDVVLIHCKMPDGSIQELTETDCGLAGGTPNYIIQAAEMDKNKSEFAREVDKWECGLGPFSGGTVGGCLVQVAYMLWYQVPAFLLWLVAYVFNVLIYVSLSSDLFKMPFVAEAWGIVRDLSNLFFILILLYIAIKIILDLGGGEAKKMIARVIIVALLINFSMFFTGIIIDTANITALIFYNQVSTRIENEKGERINYSPVGNENDIAGAIVTNFDPTTAIDAQFFTAAKAVYGKEVHRNEEDYKKDKTPMSLIIALLVFAGSLLYYVAIVLAIVSVAFLVRLIELWVLIIFSPFAFITSTMPGLASSSVLGGLGWNEWLKRLIKTAFMAPIFMFFLYFIFMLIQNKEGGLFGGIIPHANATGSSGAQLIKLLLAILLPLCLTQFLLYKALKYAVLSSGKIGEMAEKAIVGGAKAAVGLAVGAATGGAGLALTSTLGAGASAAMGKFGGGLKDAEAPGGVGGFMARMALKTGGAISAYDFSKGVPTVATLAGKAGINIERGAKMFGEGGFTERREAQIQKHLSRAKELEVGENEAAKIRVREAEARLEEERNNPNLRRLEDGDSSAAVGTPESKSLEELEKLASEREQTLNQVDKDLKRAIESLNLGIGSQSDVDAARMTRAAALNDRDEARSNLSNRRSDISSINVDFKEAQRELKAAQSSLAAENYGRRMAYANATTNREAARRIRASNGNNPNVNNP